MNHSYSTINKAIKSKSIEEYYSIVGEDVKDNIEELNSIEKEIQKLELEYIYESLKLEKTSKEEMKELMKVRKNIINGEKNDKIEIKPIGIPHFWNKVCGEIGLIDCLLPTEEERKILESIIDIEERIIEIKINKEKMKENEIIENKIFKLEFEHLYDCHKNIINGSQSIKVIEDFKMKKNLKNQSMIRIIKDKNSYDAIFHCLNNLNFEAINYFFELNKVDFDDYYESSEDYYENNNKYSNEEDDENNNDDDNGGIVDYSK